MQTRPDPMVRDVGSGFGSPESLARLAAGQRQKRRVLLRMLVNDAAAVEGSGLAEAAEHVTDDMLDHPHLGVWLVHCIRRIAHPSDDAMPLWADLGYLGWLRAAAFVTSGSAGRVDVVVRDGVVMLPGLGLARLALPGTHGHATLSGRFEFTMGDTRLVVRDPGSEGDERWLPLRKLGATYSTLRTVHLDDLDPFRDFSDPYTKAQLKAPPPRLTATQAATWKRAFAGALEILRRQYEDYSNGIDEVLRTVVPLTADPVSNGVSNTSLHAYGGVNMSAAGGPHQFALTLIHECQHAKLTALTDQAELQKPSTVKDLYAPWRDDPRPLSGLLQGIYAHIGVTDFWRIYRNDAGAKSLMAEVEFARWRTQVRQALLVAAASPLLTEAGTTFVEAMGAAVQHWSGETVPAHLEALARESSAGHLVAWRVRNMSVDVDDLLSRWTRGLDAGELPPAGVEAGVVPPRDRLPVGYVKMNRAAGIEPGPSTPAADLAYIDGDYEGALGLYKASLAEGPESWAGLALCLRQLSDEQSVSALFRRPEVVAALWRVTGADVVQLTMWLSS
ncbi:HEXXH motif domain-containing protein [Actinoplanes sp. Pm04-4]|uniref:HEXXH motif domain-containing protein n=1 Tax=Paractinoplanes pyxinae TaxID=2997416 RepID=A0ABT4AW43_9ACTN|nr:HEXXH motif domain-containing protein [Actinoplanes pyxinae]MCY1138451.1 HEXXH motif domain-containing protein [Actinoplanes pyxinae]